MNNTKTTKRALLSSVIAMFICVAMLIGTTFAWFTDSASTSVNKIQAGTLDIALEMKNADGSWVTAEGQTLKWKTADNRAQSEILWEPGCTYELQPVQIKNNGNLALKYKIAISGIAGDAKLNEAIEWSYKLADGSDFSIAEEGHLLAGDSTGAITISGHMKEDAGNEYKGLSIYGIGIIVYATQDTVEHDSTTDQYDANAKYDTAAVTAAELAAVMTPDSNGNINLTKNYIVTGAWTPLNFSTVTINGNGYTISGLDKPLVKTATNITINDLSISNSSIVGTIDTENGLGTAGFVSYLDTTTTATFKNCHLVNSSVIGNERAAGIVSYSSGATLVIEDCSVENCEIKAVGGAGGLVGYISAATTITNSSVKNTIVTATEIRATGKKPVAGGIIGTIQGAATFTDVTTTEVTVNNNCAIAAESELIGRIENGGSITIN